MIHHIAILKKNYLQLILRGQKKIECRFTRTRRPPYQKIKPGQSLWLKESGGPVRAQARVQRVLFFENLDPKQIKQLEKKYNSLILGQKAFWLAKQNSRYGSLIWLKEIQPVQPFRLTNKTMQAWLIRDQKTFNQMKVTKKNRPDD